MARYDTDEFITSLGLNPTEWHVTGEPVPKQTDPKTPAPSAVSLVTPGKDSQGKTVPAQGRDSVDWQVTITGPNGQVRVATMRPEGAGVNAANVGLNQLDWNVTGVEEQVKPPAAGTSKDEQNARVAEAQAAQKTAESNAQIAAANLAKVQADNDERQRNQAAGKGFITDDELRKNQQDGIANNLTQQQIDLRAKEIENNNKNTARSNEIAALNADTAAANAKSTADANLSRTKYEEGQLDLDQAKFDHQKSQDEIAQRNVEAKLKLDQLQQQQTNEVQQQQNTLRGQEGAETARHNAATEAAQAAAQAQAAQAAKDQAAQAAAQTATQAASSVYGAERQAQTQAGTVGGNLLSNRAQAANTLFGNIMTSAGNMSQGSAGRYGMLGGGLHAMPAGFDAGALLGGIEGFTGGLFGGQDTLDAAARMVRAAAPGAELTPQGQAAIGIIQQAYEHAQRLSGAPAAPVAAAQAARATAANGTGVVAPVTNGSYIVPINGPNGPGQMTVSATDPTAAAINANQGGNYATGTPFLAPVTVTV